MKYKSDTYAASGALLTGAPPTETTLARGDAWEEERFSRFFKRFNRDVAAKSPFSLKSTLLLMVIAYNDLGVLDLAEFTSRCLILLGLPPLDPDHAPPVADVAHGEQGDAP